MARRSANSAEMNPAQSVSENSYSVEWMSLDTKQPNRNGKSVTQKRRYASDMTAKQWATLRHYLPTRKGQVGRPMELGLRAVVNAIFYVLRAGCQWDNLPREYPNA